VAREVGVEGKLGGQASVPGAAGTWKDLTDNVNQLAANLTTQVRAIADVATAVTKGDLTRFIQVDASGEVAALKDNINEMIRNLKDTTIKNNEQDWLKTNLTKFTRMLQGQKDMLTVGKLILSELAPVVSAQHGVFYVVETAKEETQEQPEQDHNEPYLKLLASYAFRNRKNVGNRFSLGEGLVGQCYLEGHSIYLTKVPEDYVNITSGLGAANPQCVLLVPLKVKEETLGVLELAAFKPFRKYKLDLIEKAAEALAQSISTVRVSEDTKKLLDKSLSREREMKDQEERMRQNMEELYVTQEDMRKVNLEMEELFKEIKSQESPGDNQKQ